MLLSSFSLGSTALGGLVAQSSGGTVNPELIPDWIDIRFGVTRVTQHHGQCVNLMNDGFISNLTLQGYVDILHGE